MTKVLLVEDDRDLCQSICRALEQEGCLADCCHDGESALLYALDPDYGYDLAILDRMLPVMDGLTILRAMRRKGIQIPVILITGLAALEDRVDGLDSGADDYLVKPFHLKELMARVRALTRRPRQLQSAPQLSYADLSFDPAARLLTCGEKQAALTAKEGALLAVFLQDPARVFSREQLVFKVWGGEATIEPGNVDNYISFLRKRLRTLDSRCAIQTIYATGYRLEADHA